MMPAQDAPVRMGELGEPEVRRQLAAGAVVLWPLGSFESHGPVLPMGDYLAAEAIAVRIARAAMAAGQACLVAPCLPFGGADYFGSVPGGMALGQGTLRAVLADLLGGFVRHGVRRLVLLNGHGGNAQAVHDVTLAVRQEHGVVIPSFYLWKIARVLMDRVFGAQDAAARAGHGADPVASIAMHLFGAAGFAGPVAEAAALLGLPVNGFGSGSFQGLPIDLPVQFDEIAPGGVVPWVDPGRASAADGAVLTELLVQAGAAFVLHHTGQVAG